MDIFQHIDRMKEKPEHVRKRFAFLVSFAITFVIFAGWMASYGLKSSPILAKDQNKVDKPVSSLTASVGDIWDDIKSMFSGSNKFEYSSDNLEVKGGSR